MTQRRYGGFWRRSAAYFIDQIILYFITLTLAVIGLLALGVNGDMIKNISSAEEISRGLGAAGLVYCAASLLAGVTYFTWFHGMGGRTPGKMLFGLRVIQASGEPMTPGLAFLRWVGYLISGFVFCLGFLWVAFDSRKQGWHDKIAATIVIRERGNVDPSARNDPEDKRRDATAASLLVSEASTAVEDPVASVSSPDGQVGKQYTGDEGSQL